jgi:acyl-CoA thioesterase FadM
VTDGFGSAFRVRFDEAGPDGRLRTSGVLRYTQDLAAQHSEALGYDRAWYAARGLTWMVRTADIEILAPIPYGSALTGTTRVVGFRRVWSRRESTFRLGGEVAALVRIDWVLLDARGAPTRIPPEFETIFGVAAPPDAPLQLARVPLEPAPATAMRRAIEVRDQELDPLDHVNNATYADWLDEAVRAAAPGDGAAPDERAVSAIRSIPRRARLEYALPAAGGERLESTCWPAGDGWSCRIVRPVDGAELLRARLEPGVTTPPAGPARDPG